MSAGHERAGCSLFEWVLAKGETDGRRSNRPGGKDLKAIIVGGVAVGASCVEENGICISGTGSDSTREIPL